MKWCIVFSKSVNGVDGPSIVVHVCDEAKNGKYKMMTCNSSKLSPCTY